MSSFSELHEKLLWLRVEQNFQPFLRWPKTSLHHVYHVLCEVASSALVIINQRPPLPEEV